MDDVVWKRKRTVTSSIYLLLVFISALETSISYSTSWLYLKKVSNDSKYLGIYYGLSQSAYAIPAILFSNIIAHYGDKYRRIRLLIMIVNILTMIGCVVYLIPGSPALVIIGRFLIGFNITVVPLIVGELARSYNKTKFQSMLTWLSGLFVFGKAAGPLFVALFLTTDVYIGPFHVVYENVSSVIIFCSVVLVQILVFLFASDLSKIYDLKKESSQNASFDELEILFKENCDENMYAKNSVKEGKENLEMERKSVKQLFKSIVEDGDVFFIIISSLCYIIIVQVVYLVIPVIILENLHYSKSGINVAMAAQLICFALIIVVLYLFKLKQVTNGLLGWISTIASLAVTLVVSTKFSFTLNLVLLIAVLTFIEVAMLKLKIFFAMALASMVQSEHQSFMESIRFQSSRVGSLVGSLIAATSIRYTTEMYCIFIALSVIFFIVTLFKRKMLKENHIRI